VRGKRADRDPTEPVRPSLVGALAAGVAGILIALATMLVWGIGTAAIGNLNLVHGVEGPRIVGLSVLVHAVITGLLGNRIRKRGTGAQAALGIGLLIGACLEVLLAGPCALGHF
jgi:hypothetical protein